MRPTTVNGRPQHAGGADLDRRIVLQHGRHLAQILDRVGILEHTRAAILADRHDRGMRAELTSAPQLGQETICTRLADQFFSSSALALS
jgi:hypothetical protein